ncbi:uncharacterized protein METZ01_LOCUS434172, partial [marine metagenome]
RETIREEERESDVQHKETIDAMKKAGGLGAAGLAGADADGGGGGFLSSLLGSYLGGKGGKGLLSKKVLSRFALVPLLAKLGPLLMNPYVLGAIAVGGLAWWLLSGDDDEETTARKKAAKRTSPSMKKIPTVSGSDIDTKGIPQYAKGILEIGKTGPGMVSKGDTILDNKAAKDFRQGMGTFKNLMGHEEGIGTVTDNYLANLHAGEIQIKGGIANTMGQVINLLTDKFGSNAIFAPYGEGHTQSLTANQLKIIGRGDFGTRIKN